VAASLADHTWKEHKADWLIGAHAVAPGHVLVTNNAADYPHVLRKMTPTQLMSRRRG
jgi:predicted nucleic acid-binding protein